MSGDHDQTPNLVRIGANPTATPHREEMWEVISESWDAQVARHKRMRIVRSRLVLGGAIAATLIVGVFAGRWSVPPDPNVAPAIAVTGVSGVSAARQIALREHLRDVETLLVLFEAEAGREDGLGEQARDLAAASRMQMSYGTAQDAELESLLQDLELLLLQVAHVAGAADSTELEITLAGIRDSDAIARMRLLRSQDSPLGDI